MAIDGCLGSALVLRFKTARRYMLITPQIAAGLVPLDARAYAAGTLGADPEGFYKPPTG